jgi:uroporphyrin-3 C-methyltransferase
MTESSTNKRSYKNLWILLVALLVIAAGAIFLTKYWLQITKDTTQLHRQAVVLNNRMDAIQQEISNISQHSQQELTAQHQNEIQRAFRLTKLAADSLQTTRNVPLAMQLLQAAQDGISDIKDPAVDKIRIMLEVDQQKLSAINYQDYTTIIAKIATLESLVKVLEVKGKPQKVIIRPITTPHKDTTVLSEKTATPQWQQILSQTFNNIKSSIKIRKKSEADLEHAFTNNEYKRARFSLLLEELRWSVYYGDANVYQYTINELQTLIRQAFNGANPNVEKFSQILTELAALQIHPVLPNLQDTVNALQALLVG